MSWKFSSILIRKDYSSDWNVLRDQLRIEKHFTGTHLSWTDSISYDFGNTALGVWNGCTMMNRHSIAYNSTFTPEEEYEQDTKCMQLSLEADVMTLYVDGITGSGGFTWYHGGKRVRIFQIWAGKLKADFGPLLPSEKGKVVSGEDPESRVLDVMGFMIAHSFSDLLQANPDMVELA